MGVERFQLLRFAEPGDHVARRAERVLLLREVLDEPRPALEELGQLVGRQLPR
jgi:hypothetical protein